MYKSVRLFIIAYLAAMASMALLGGTVFVNDKTMIEAQSRYGEMINVSGRQRMLSQRIVLLADRLAYEASEDADHIRAKLETAINLMEASHERLTRGDMKWRADSPNADALNALYFAGPGALDIMVRDHVNKARNWLAADPKSGIGWQLDDDLLESLDTAVVLYEYNDDLLEPLNDAVNLYESSDKVITQKMRDFSDTALIASIAILAMLTIFVFRPIVRRLQESEHDLRKVINSDFLTGCANRRGFVQATETMMALMKRNSSSLSVIVMDIDHFKKVNDTHGHAVGDEVLKHVAKVATGVVRASDIIGRMGGEEFAICLPDASLDAGLRTAEKVRAALEAKPYIGLNVEISVTASFGVCTARSVTMTKPDLMLDLADKALYLAKQAGRNKVCAAPHVIGETGRAIVAA